MLQRFTLSWRAWLTDRLTGDWLDGKAYYRARFIDDTIDNPDQRIQSDIDIFTAVMDRLPTSRTRPRPITCCSARSRRSPRWSRSPRSCGTCRGPWVSSGSTSRGLCSGSGWSMSCFATVIAFWIGKPYHLAQLQQREVQRRVPLRAGAVARCRGGGRLLPRRARRTDGTAAALRAHRRQLQAVSAPGRSVSTAGTGRCRQIIVPLPHVLQFPRFFNGEIKLGDLTQSASAFGQNPERAVVLPQRLRPFASYRAAIIRLHGSGRRQRRGQGAAGGD